jgi:uncharacterized caspase-like protein
MLRLLWLALLLAFAPAPAFAEKIQQLAALKPAPGGERRVALVIGNSGYKVAPLRNPANDARAMARALAETGFTVTHIEDATQSSMRRAIRDFGDELLRGGVGLFYYAGHGMQVRGRNFLIPVNADIQREDEVEDQGVDANLVLAKMDSARNRLNILILDACRNNPFQRSFRSAQQGLAQMDAPSGTLIAFATAPGQVAADGEGDNGLYTKHLLGAMREPGLPVEQLFKQVRIGVTKEVGEKQIPWESSSLKGDFYFVAPDPNAAAAAQKASIDKAVGEAVRAEQDRAAKEREALQAQMKQLIEQMLAKQRAELEAELKKREGQQPIAAAPRAAAPASAPAPAPAAAPAPVPAPQPAAARQAEARPASAAAPAAAAPAAAPAVPKPAPAPPPASAPAAPAAKPPVQVAAAAPTAVSSAARSRMPATGDRWVYQVWFNQQAGKKSEATAEVRGVVDGAILEDRVQGDGSTGQNVWTDAVNQIGPSFAPFLLAYKNLKIGDRWENVPFQNLGGCSSDPFIQCRLDAEVAAKEKVTVPAGTFDAWRIRVTMTVVHRGGAGSRVTDLWYADEVKRPVKAVSRVHNLRSNDIDSELVSFRLN